MFSIRRTLLRSEDVTATVGIGPRSEGGFGLEIGLSISLPGLLSADAHALVEKRLRSARTPMLPETMSM